MDWSLACYFFYFFFSLTFWSWVAVKVVLVNNAEREREDGWKERFVGHEECKKGLINHAAFSWEKRAWERRKEIWLKKKKEIKKRIAISYRESDEGGGEKTILSFVEASGQDILLKLISILSKWFPREDPNKWMPKDIPKKKKKYFHGNPNASFSTWW